MLEGTDDRTHGRVDGVVDENGWRGRTSGRWTDGREDDEDG